MNINMINKPNFFYHGPQKKQELKACVRTVLIVIIYRYLDNLWTFKFERERD